jgi:predicted dinucleotide-binding enzyme
MGETRGQDGLRIAVLGAGNIGGTLGRKWVAAGHRVAFGVADPEGERARALRAELGDRARIGSAADAIAAGAVVVLAVPGGAMDETIRANAAGLDGKIVVDAANRMGGGGPANSLATLRQATPRARVYRAFNTLGWENFADPVFDGAPADLFFCGPDGEGRAAVERLIADVGLRPIWVGDLDQIEVVDGVLRLWFALAVGQRKGRNLAFKLLTR